MENNKVFNVIYVINKVWFLITLGMFATIVFGFLAEIVLGGLQVLSSLLILFYWKKISQEQKSKLYLYWAIVGIYFMFWQFDWRNIDEWFVHIVCVGVVPMIIGVYFLKILNSIKKKKSSDIMEEIGIS